MSNRIEELIDFLPLPLSTSAEEAKLKAEVLRLYAPNFYNWFIRFASETVFTGEDNDPEIVTLRNAWNNMSSYEKSTSTFVIEQIDEMVVQQTPIREIETRVRQGYREYLKGLEELEKKDNLNAQKVKNDHPAAIFENDLKNDIKTNGSFEARPNTHFTEDNQLQIKKNSSLISLGIQLAVLIPFTIVLINLLFR